MIIDFGIFCLIKDLPASVAVLAQPVTCLCHIFNGLSMFVHRCNGVEWFPVYHFLHLNDTW